ncbi:MAG: tryptophan synthase subunit alpha [Dehalococcoidales bacterium]|nr:tryptophan synthase subunit alpha [Dehalococcoidales bacterium]
MNQIKAIFKPGHKALIAYLTVGYPTVEATVKAAATLAESGVDIIELGIPFSDPLADGATIQQASYQALKQGITPQACLEVAGRLHQKIATPLVFMSYYNPILSFGLEAFCQASAEAGISGLIIPDLPPEEGSELEASTQRHQLDLIYLLAPTSTEERISLVATRSRGFIYLVSLTGVTGSRQNLSADLEDFVKRIRKQATQPLCVGFGISRREQAKRVAMIADGVIVGSHLLQLIEGDTSLASLKSFTLSLRQVLDSP